MSGEFTCEGGQAVKVAGFCDATDGSVFRIRFLPTRPGPHTYSVTLRQGDYTQTHPGSFTVRDGKRPGLLRVDPEHLTHFMFAGTGQHFFWNSTTAYSLLGWQDEAIIRESLDRLARLKVNRIRVALTGRTTDGMAWKEPDVRPSGQFQFRLEPWPAARPKNIADPGYDVTRFNLDHFQKCERMLAHARKLGIQVSLILYVDGSDPGVNPFGKARMDGADEQRYYRYAVVRFAAFANVMWDVSNEWHSFRDEAWVEKMGAFIRVCDPYHHLISVHGRGDFPFRKSPWADFAMYQRWDESGGYAFMLMNLREQAETGRVIPQVNEEYGYEDHYPIPSGGGNRHWPTRTADNRRRIAWEISMAGGYQTTGERANGGTGAGADTGGGWINGRGDEHMTMLLGYRHMIDFFTSIPWWTLDPRDDLAEKDTLLLAVPAARYVAYVAQPHPASFQLARGSYRAKWFNPRTGAWIELPDIAQTVDAKWISPTPPDAGDWALLVEAKL